jgi:ribose transport system substrate-binding protein
MAKYGLSTFLHAPYSNGTYGTVSKLAGAIGYKETINTNSYKDYEDNALKWSDESFKDGNINLTIGDDDKAVFSGLLGRSTKTLTGGKVVYAGNLNDISVPVGFGLIENIRTEAGLKYGVKFYPNVNLKFFDGGYDVNNQISQINDCVTQGYDAIIIECMDTEALNGAIGDAEAAGVPVISVNQGVSGVHTLHIQGSDYKAGWQAAEILSKKIGGKGNAVLLDVPHEQKASGRMGTGFEDYLAKNTQIKLIEKPGIANWSQENANTTMRDILTKYPNPGDINIVYGACDDIAMGAVQAIEAAGRGDEGILVFGNIGYPHGLQAVKDGRLFGTGYSDMYQEDTVTLTMTLHAIETGTTAVKAGYKKTPSIDLVVLPCTAENVDQVIGFSHWEQLMDFH